MKAYLFHIPWRPWIICMENNLSETTRQCICFLKDSESRFKVIHLWRKTLHLKNLWNKAPTQPIFTCAKLVDFNHSKLVEINHFSWFPKEKVISLRRVVSLWRWFYSARLREHQNIVWNLFKVTSENKRTTSRTLL